MADAFRLEGKTVVLTGAAGVVGVKAVLSLVEGGARVYAIDRSSALLQQRLGPEHGLLMHCAADMTRREFLLQAGLRGLTRYLATYWGDRGVRVNAVTAGAGAAGQADDFVAELSRWVPLRRMAEAEDVTNAMRYLVSDAAAYVTGQNLVVDGGWTAW